MNRLPVDFDLSEYVGEQLGQICVDPYQVQLNFDSLSIVGSGTLETEFDGVTVRVLERTWITTAGLERFIGRTILSWERRSDNCFCINFEGEASLVFHTEVSQYEDFIVWDEGANWIVL